MTWSVNPNAQWLAQLEAARRSDERAQACREVGLEANAAKHADVARRRRLWAECMMCRVRAGK